MPYLPDIDVNALEQDPDERIRSIVKQVNEAFRLISNESLVQIYKDQSGTIRFLQGLLPDNTVGIRVSKENIDAVSAADNELIYKSDFATDTYYDDSDARILLGKLPDGTYGFVISQEGTDVLTVFE